MIDWRIIDNKTILLSGATGLIGKTFIEFVLQRNESKGTHTRVIAISRNEKKFRERFANVQLTEDIVYMERDVNDPIKCDERIDYIIHLASNTHPKLYATEPIKTELTNIIGTKNLLDLAVLNPGCVFFFMSSNDVYGENNTGKELLDEKSFGYVDCNTLRAGYIEGKRAGEALCNAYSEEKKVDFFIGRMCRSFGENMQPTDSRAISQFIMRAVNREDVILKSSGEQIFSYLKADDVVTAILCILTKGKPGEAYNIADNTQILKLKELASIIAKIGEVNVSIGTQDATERKGASGFQNVCLDSTKLNSLGWKPQSSLEEGLRETIIGLRNQV